MLNKYDIVKKIEDFCPIETQDSWDCSGWIVEKENTVINKILFALTITDKIVEQALQSNCDMIISHHPLFFVPIEYKDINMYCAHTNLDKAIGGTTDTLIEKINLQGKIETKDYVRIINLDKPLTLNDLKEKLLKISPKLKYINNNKKNLIKTIGVCAGSGSEFIFSTNTDAFITGDIKFHTALDVQNIVFDIGHFESEIFAPHILKKITGINEKGIIANEESPFI